jgi:hypothetical protein
LITQLAQDERIGGERHALDAGLVGVAVDEGAVRVLLELGVDVVERTRALVVGALEAHAADEPETILKEAGIGPDIARGNRFAEFAGVVHEVLMDLRLVEDEPRRIRLVEFEHFLAADPTTFLPKTVGESVMKASSNTSKRLARRSAAAVEPLGRKAHVFE